MTVKSIGQGEGTNLNLKKDASRQWASRFTRLIPSWMKTPKHSSSRNLINGRGMGTTTSTSLIWVKWTLMKIKYDVIIPQLRTPAPTLMNYSALGEEG